MTWPLSQDYNETIQSPATCFSDPELRLAEATCNALGIPMPRSGNFADVYEMTHPSGRKWAVKCFTRQVSGLRERYAAISAHLRQVNLPFMVDFSYLEQGIKIKGQWYPVLKMDWVEGSNLNEFIRTHAGDGQCLDIFGRIWVILARRLREARVAHGDLQHGNILLVPGSGAIPLSVKLIDYDGMFVPALARKQSGEVGHPAFQHPQRLRDGAYNAEVDRFPHLVIYTALRGLIQGGSDLWNRYDNGDNLLFRQQDLEAPAHSALFRELRSLRDDQLPALLEQLTQATARPVEQTPLLDDLLGGKPAPAPVKRPAAVAIAAPVSPPPVPIVPAGPRPLPAKPAVTRPAPGVPGWVWVGGAGLVMAMTVGLVLAAFIMLGPSNPTPPPKPDSAVQDDPGPEKPPEPPRVDPQPPPDPPRKDPEPKPAPLPVTTRIEAEDLPVLRKSGDFAIGPQDTAPLGRGWSNDKHLFAQPRKVGDWVELALPVAAEGTYQVQVHVTKSNDYGIVQFRIDGQPLGKPVNNYRAKGVASVGPVALGKVALKQGTATLRIEVVGTSPKSVGGRYHWGLDCVVLKPDL